MKIQHIPVHPMLKGYVEKIWVFESDGKVPDDDMKLIVPNGLVKLIIPFKNGLHGKMEGWELTSAENKVTLIGICDKPSIVDIQEDAASGSIGVEFNPMGVYRFFSIRQSEIRNTIHLFTDVFGRQAAVLEEMLVNEPFVNEKLRIIERFLLSMFNTKEDSVFEYCTQKIAHTKGLVTVKQLEKETGYSSRWLHMKFDEKIGISPKNLCAITRFHTAYQSITFNVGEDDIYNLYYDQAHFIREFKRFTGLPPAKFEKMVNEFDKIFYR